MNHKGMLYAGVAAASAVGLAETVLRLRDRAAAEARYRREHWALARPWERFDYRSGWELQPGFDSGDVRVNARGFRGPELEAYPERRVLCLGGSATFGPLGEDAPWPRVLREALNAGNPEAPVEVINAGVTGHTTDNMRFRLGRILHARPDVTVILAGGEDLLVADITRYRDTRQPFCSFWHMESQRTVRCHVWSLFRETAGLGIRKPFPLSYDPEEFVPFNFEYNLRGMLDRLLRGGSVPVLVTMPSLVPENPDLLDDTIRTKAVLPSWLGEDDFMGFRAVRCSYDAIVRALAAEGDFPLIDAVRVFEDTDLPRHTLFEDLFRLTPEGCRLMGETVARELREKEMA